MPKYFTIVIRADDEKAACALVPGEKIGPNTIAACSLGDALSRNDSFKALIPIGLESKVCEIEQADLEAFLSADRT